MIFARKAYSVFKRKLTFRSCKYQRFIIIKPASVYKVTWGKRSTLIKNEFIASMEASQSMIWADLGVFFELRHKMGGLIISSAPRMREKVINYSLITDLSDMLLNRMNYYDAYAHWWETLHQASFDIAWSALEESEKELLMRKLGNLKLPVTSAHGDLSPANIFANEQGSIKLIDWEYYRPYGSIVTDLLRLFCFFYRLNPGYHNVSLSSQYAIEDFTKYNIYSYLSKRLGIDEEQLAFLSSISNAAMPVIWTTPAKRVEGFKYSIGNYIT